MAFSVNTNTGAMAALQSLNQTNRGLSQVQSRINTGLNVASTKDDSASFTIAQSLRGDVGGLSAVNSSLNRGKSTVDVAIAGAEQISDVLNQMKAKAIQASDDGLDAESRTAINADYTALKEQITTIIASSEFNGTNVLKDDATSTGKVSALQSLDTTSTIGVANQAFDTNVTTALGTGLGTKADADTALTEIATVTATVTSTLSTLGSASRKIEGQLSFNSKLSDVIESGIGNLVDADLAKESAKLQALQVKQQLGVQALSIANQAPQTITSLFR
ncbi:MULTISPECIES: flagellin [Citromicrobium]|uniref:flagellin n=1 Tax=Citromicrobium TaxID=72173 RepID=UPI0001DD0B48|nr:MULTISPECIES: flagellin [Citromicrobium]ALG60243.1 flagellin [Citromicrobium sp. JL477]KPM18911.1 flagellin [Citromicrobium sp. JL1351]KPM20631.1 flagellin [Citromicrobium sp. JL31]KPM29899.1 flagellin [Citromicrobium sp. JL2201]